MSESKDESKGGGGESLVLRRAGFVIPGREYLLHVCQDWFVGSFSVEDHRIVHSCSGRDAMWDGYTLERLRDLGFLRAVYELPSLGSHAG